jgi:asparagine synthase (glutamine-hydrolysing)
MCGIAGWIDWEEDLTNYGSTIERMANTQCQRGPDAQGQWLSQHAALAHRRLMVIDPEGGGQPMLYQHDDSLYALTYNGEIYNFKELRSELELRGHTFRTSSDTEVLLHAYEEWDIDCLHRLNGIFAFGLWDEQRQRLLLARDHLGVKPLFYAQRGNAVLFGSELKALLAHPLVQPEIDNSGLSEIFAFRRTPGSGIYKDIHELRPAHYALFTLHQTVIQPFWSLRSAAHTQNAEETAEFIRSLLIDTVRRQLIADVPVVTMLSGGLDSSGLTALAAREFKQAGKMLDTYSIDFVDSAENFEGSLIRPDLDAPWVKHVADYVGSRHHTVIVDTPELIENLLVPMRAHDLPAIGQIETSLYLLFKAMKQHATVALSGESADEVFGGYPWFHNQAVIDTPTFPWLAMMMLRSGGNGNMSRARSAMTGWLADDVIRRARPGEFIAQQYRQALAEVPRREGESAQTTRMREIFYLHLTYFLPMLLDRKDRMSMATGFEVRVPFCDYRLVEYVWNIPWDMKNTGNIEKGILREAFKGILPDDARTRKKSAYPSTQNPSYLDALRQWTLHILDNKNEPIHNFIKPEVMRAIAEQKIALPGEAGVFLFEKVIQTNAWFREYKVSIV